MVKIAPLVIPTDTADTAIDVKVNAPVTIDWAVSNILSYENINYLIFGLEKLMVDFDIKTSVIQTE